MKRLPELLLVLALLALLALATTLPVRAAEEGVPIPVDCGQTVCVLPKRIWEAPDRGP